MHDDVDTPGRLDDGFFGIEIGVDDLRPGGKPLRSRRRSDHRADLVARETGSADDRTADGSSRPEDGHAHVEADTPADT